MSLSNLLKAVARNFASTLTACPVLVASPQQPVDSSPCTTKEEAAQRTFKLMQSQNVEICAVREGPPAAANKKLVDDLEMALKESMKMVQQQEHRQGPALYEDLLGQLCRAVTHPMALSISFRRAPKITSQFLTAGPEIDFETIKVLRLLCQQHDVVYKRLLQAVVSNQEQIIRKNYVRSIGSAA